MQKIYLQFTIYDLRTMVSAWIWVDVRSSWIVNGHETGSIVSILFKENHSSSSWEFIIIFSRARGDSRISANFPRFHRNHQGSHWTTLIPEQYRHCFRHFINREFDKNVLMEVLNLKRSYLHSSWKTSRVAIRINAFFCLRNLKNCIFYYLLDRQLQWTT